MEQLINSLPVLLRQSNGADELAEAAAMAAWNHVAGEALRHHAVPAGFRDKRLIVAVANSVWQKQLAAMSAQLLRSLNTLLGQSLIASIEFRVEPNEVETEQRKRMRDARQTVAGKIPDGVMPFELVSAAASIRDPDLRRAFLGAALSCVRRLEEQKE